MLSVDTVPFLSSCCLLLWGSNWLPAIRAAVYHFPIVKKMVDTSPVDAVFLEPTDGLCEDPFVLPDILGYFGMPDPVHWAVPTDLNRLLGIVKLVRVLGQYHRAPQQRARNWLLQRLSSHQRQEHFERRLEITWRVFICSAPRWCRCVIYYFNAWNSIQLQLHSHASLFLSSVFTIIHRSRRAAFCVFVKINGR